ncbi:hypothetical protein GOODEAATRI_011993, partial [Goodea atripinnis]
DQNDVIDKHTQAGLDLLERYIKFVKERTEIEQNYAKQLSNHASFQEILNELGDYAGQRELIAENMTANISDKLTKYLQDLKQERKTDSKLLIEQYKSGFERPADVEFEDYSQGVKPSNSESALNPLKGRKHKIFKKHKVNLTVFEVE